MDLIYAARYTEVCDYAWHDFADNNLDLPAGIWYVDVGVIPNFFQRIRLGNNQLRKYVIVSPSSDFGVCLQQYNHPALDMAKWLKMQMQSKNRYRTHGYQDLMMSARINRKRCKESDTYSIKCWSYTEATFPEIPNNVAQWFLANCDIEHPNVTPIPFGIYGNKNLLETSNKISNYNKSIPRNKNLYVNFQFYNTDRYELFLYYKSLSERFNIGITCKRDVNFDEYLYDLASHKFVLCPPGNGYDCYRTLETIYMGAIPVLQYLPGCVRPYMNLKYPILCLENLLTFPIDKFDSIYNNAVEYLKSDISEILWPYWEQRILSSHSLIG